MNQHKKPIPSNAYPDLIDGLCTLFEVPESEERHERCEFHLGGALVTLIPSGLKHQPIDGLAYFVEVGAAPRDKPEEFAKLVASLLEANILLTGIEEPRFCLHPVTDQVVLSGCLSVERHTPASVREILLELPEYLEEFRNALGLAATDTVMSPPVPLAATHAFLQLRRP